MVDRRVQKTLEALHQALIELILKKGYDGITVKDILDKANVGRSTFYAHYSNKEELLESGLHNLKKLLTSHQKSTRALAVQECRLVLSRALFDHAASYRDVYRAMVGKHAGRVVINRMHALLTDLVHKELSAIAMPENLSGIPRSAVVHYVVDALLSMLTWWVDQKSAEYSPADMESMFRRLVLPAVLPEAWKECCKMDEKHRPRHA